MTTETAEETLIRVLGSIARGLHGKPVTGKDAMLRARDTLTVLGIDWKTPPQRQGEPR